MIKMGMSEDDSLREFRVGRTRYRSLMEPGSQCTPGT